MANVLILGGGFGGVVAAERLAKQLAPEHQITLVSRSRRFTFYPGLVRLAFGRCEPEDVSFDLREAMLDRRVRFIEAEVARVDPHARKAQLARGEMVGDLGYDYLIFAMGRRLATERVKGFYEHADHLLSVEAALEFGARLRDFRHGHAVIGSCPGSRLTVPVYETAFALSRLLEERGDRERTRITIVSPEYPSVGPGGADIARAARPALDAHHIQFMPQFPIAEIDTELVRTDDGLELEYDLLMLIPPFEGPAALLGAGVTDGEGYVRVDHEMRVHGVEQMYAVGDAVNFPGPKMGHMAVRQAEVAAANVAAEIERRAPAATYDHEIMLVIDEGGKDSVYLHKKLWGEGEKSVMQGRFWGWIKQAHEKYWQAQHS